MHRSYKDFVQNDRQVSCYLNISLSSDKLIKPFPTKTYRDASINIYGLSLRSYVKVVILQLRIIGK